MKSIEFTEEQFHNISELGEKLFDDEQDPRSSAYIRELKRPHINWGKIVIFIMLPILISTAITLILNHIGFEIIVAIAVAAAFLLVYIIAFLKKSIICLIRIYQRYAPLSLRNKCRFEPSCSEYMILSIEKYGLIKGFEKGICRLKRCNIDGGGFDFP